MLEKTLDHLLPKDSDQTAQMHSLIRVFDRRTCQPVPFHGYRLKKNFKRVDLLTVSVFHFNLAMILPINIIDTTYFWSTFCNLILLK